MYKIDEELLNEVINFLANKHIYSEVYQLIDRLQKLKKLPEEQEKPE